MLGEIAARLFGPMAEKLLSKLPAGFERALAAALKETSITIVAVAIVISDQLGPKLYDTLASAALRIVAKIFIENPQQRAAAEILGRQIQSELAGNVSVIYITFWSCLAVTALFLGLPLLHRTMFRRNLRIFVSFNQLRTDIAEQLHAFLEKCRFRVSRVPFDTSAEHQATLEKIADLLRQSELVVCIPGPSNSFVEHEIFAARMIHHPVILLISENDGAIPDTADKCYPAFQMETLLSQGFQPIEAFISFIGGDLRSMWHICSQALRQGLVRRLSLAILSALVFVIFGPWALCLVIVLNTQAATAARQASSLIANVAIGTHLAFMALCASVTALCVVYCVRVVQSQVRQLHAQRRVQLKVKAAEFRRVDWIELMSGLSSGSSIYRAMFDTAPLAHHEKLRSARPA